MVGSEEWASLPNRFGSGQARGGGELIAKYHGVCGGEACIKGTRIAVWMLEGYRRLGLDDAALKKSYPQVTEEQLKAALVYAAEHPEEMDRAIRANEEA